MKKYLILHPLFFAVARVLSLYAHNVEQVSPSELVGPIGLAVALVLVAFLVILSLVRNLHKTGILLTLLILATFLFEPLDHLSLAVLPRTGIAGLPLHSLATGAALAVPVFALGFWNLRTKRSLQMPTGFLNLTAGLVLLFPLASLGIHAVRQMPGYLTKANPDAGNAPIDANPGLPDIYYIILDGYGREDILQEMYHYDNGPFVEKLRARGFYVADKSISNYSQTTLCLSSTLNLEYLDTLGIAHGQGGEDRKPLGDAIATNFVVKFLRGHGYTFIAFASGTRRTEFPNADVYLKGSIKSSEFKDALLGTAPLPTKSRYDGKRGRTAFILEGLAKIPEAEGPRFVFAHVISPHPPFVWDADGTPVQPNRKYRLADGDAFIKAGGTQEEYIREYPKQLEHISNMMLRAIDGILAKEPNSLIVFQGDHGPGSGLSTKDIAKTNLRERHSILNAYYFPQGGEEDLYPTISPINTFRIIFNHYFNTGYELLPDRAYFSLYPTPFLLKDVTDEVTRPAQ